MLLGVCRMLLRGQVRKNGKVSIEFSYSEVIYDPVKGQSQGTIGNEVRKQSGRYSE